MIFLGVFGGWSDVVESMMKSDEIEVWDFFKVTEEL